MSATGRCDREALVDRHFSGGLPPARESELREHLRGCERCRHRYERALLFAKLDPAAESARARLGRGLGLRLRPQRRWLPALGLAVPAAAAAALALVVWVRPAEPPVFVARGSGEPAAPRLLVYRVPTDGAPAPAREAVQADDALAFAYENPGGHARYLMVFGVDEHGHVYWYHPAWTQPEADPAAVPISATEGLRELPEAVRHALDGERLVLHGLFLEQPLTVRAAEALVARLPEDRLPADVRDERIPLVVRRRTP